MTNHEELREAVRDELAHWPIGSGYYETTVDIDSARDRYYYAEKARVKEAEGIVPTETWRHLDGVDAAEQIVRSMIPEGGK